MVILFKLETCCLVIPRCCSSWIVRAMCSVTLRMKEMTVTAITDGGVRRAGISFCAVPKQNDTRKRYEINDILDYVFQRESRMGYFQRGISCWCEMFTQRFCSCATRQVERQRHSILCKVHWVAGCR